MARERAIPVHVRGDDDMFPFYYEHPAWPRSSEPGGFARAAALRAGFATGICGSLIPALGRSGLRSRWSCSWSGPTMWPGPSRRRISTSRRCAFSRQSRRPPWPSRTRRRGRLRSRRGALRGGGEIGGWSGARCRRRGRFARRLAERLGLRRASPLSGFLVALRPPARTVAKFHPRDLRRLLRRASSPPCQQLIRVPVWVPV